MNTAFSCTYDATTISGNDEEPTCPSIFRSTSISTTVPNSSKSICPPAASGSPAAPGANDTSPTGSSPPKSSAILAAPCDKLRHSSRTMYGQNPNKMEPKCTSFVTGLNTICPEKRWKNDAENGENQNNDHEPKTGLSSENQQNHKAAHPRMSTTMSTMTSLT